MPDNTVPIELNFIEEADLSRYGMIREIKTEFDIIRFCLSNMMEMSIRDIPLHVILRKAMCML